jgi:hypothetical protein
MKNAHVILVGKPEGKTLLERLRRRWNNNSTYLTCLKLPASKELKLLKK